MQAVEWYDRADVYDVAFGWDPGRERDFVLGASERYGISRPRRILEPFCGTGRLLRAMPASAVGFDRNARMVRYAARRGAVVFRAEAARFALRPASCQLAYCLIDSFRYLLTEDAARSHLRAVARALAPGALYVLGFDVTGDLPADVSAETWTQERGGVVVETTVRGLGDPDPETRLETVHVSIRVARGATVERIEDFQAMRVYARADVARLLATEGSFDIAACFARDYDLASPCTLDAIAGSTVLVLRRRG